MEARIAKVKMRTAFINELIVQARKRPEIFLVVGDLGYSVVEPFAKEFPDRYLNAGVAEQNALGVCAGLAREGYHPFFYSIANFSSMRGFEFIRNDICYHDLPVTVVSVGAGFAYGNLGYSHHAVQDIGVMRTLPNLAILSPADPGETTQCVQWLCEHPQPGYLRIGKAGEKILLGRQDNWDGLATVLRNGQRKAIICTGSILSNVMEASPRKTIRPEVYSCSKLSPWNDSFTDRLSGYDSVLIVEEHVAAGGLASILREHGVRVSESICVPTHVLNMVGSQDYLRKQSGMDADSIRKAIETL